MYAKTFSDHVIANNVAANASYRLASRVQSFFASPYNRTDSSIFGNFRLLTFKPNTASKNAQLNTQEYRIELTRSDLWISSLTLISDLTL